ncbi:hypothetical protein C2U39_06800 [Aeromonas sp. ASNIH3]|nr:hypothetical protein C2U39_06800 [Aeromonas sp. ASNIH3]
MYWQNVSELDEFQKSLGQLLLRSSRAEPSLAFDYLQRATNSERIRDNAFHDIVAYSPILAQSLPKSLVDLSLAYLIKELPDDRVARKREESRKHAEWRKATLAKPEEERTQRDKMILSSNFHPLAFDDFSYHEWERLSIHDDYRYFPSSPLRQPFHALFQSAPEEGMRLIRELCNHAMASWRQLHRHSRDRQGTPIPLVLKFPWGSETFWGTDREYLWFRSTWAPKIIGCGFMALEEWCFAELERGRSVDSLIQQVVKDNECIAILGIASMLALCSGLIIPDTILGGTVATMT